MRDPNLGGALLSGQHVSIGQAFGYFGVGFASGVAFEYGGPLASGAIAGFGNSLVSGSNLQTAIVQGVVGAGSFYLGGVAGKQVSGLLTSAGVGGFINGAVSGAIGGAVGGFSNGVANGEINGLSTSNSLDMGLNSALSGAAYGGAIGGASLGYEAVKNNDNFWTGAERAPGRSNFSFNNRPTEASGFRKGYFDEYNTNGNVVAQKKVWIKDISNSERSIQNYEVWGISKQEAWDMVSGNSGDNLSIQTTAGPKIDAVAQKWFYYSIATSTEGPTIVLSILNQYGNYKQWVKYRFLR